MNVLQLANELEISEYEVFIKAYKHYYGANVKIDSFVLDYNFKQYLNRNEIPIYVNSFLRNFDTLEA